MKERIMNIVNALLQQSGQTIPAKNLSIGNQSLQIYDVEHWPETFNTLLVHDFPSIIISIDSSSASLSGFVITIKWARQIDRSDSIRFLVYILFMCAMIFYVSNTSLAIFHRVSPEKIETIRGMYAGNHAADVVGSVLTDELRAVMAQGGL
jgi:hypothetical protein